MKAGNGIGPRKQSLTWNLGDGSLASYMAIGPYRWWRVVVELLLACCSDATVKFFTFSEL